jgi:hypothetical protein
MNEREPALVLSLNFCTVLHEQLDNHEVIVFGGFVQSSFSEPVARA